MVDFSNRHSYKIFEDLPDIVVFLFYGFVCRV